MGMRAAQDIALRLARHGDVIRVAATALEQARILDATDGLAQAELRHGTSGENARLVRIISSKEGTWKVRWNL